MTGPKPITLSTDWLVRTQKLVPLVDHLEQQAAYIGASGTEAYYNTLDEGGSEKEAQKNAKAVRDSLTKSAIAHWLNSVKVFTAPVYSEYGVKIDYIDKHAVRVLPVTTWVDAADLVRLAEARNSHVLMALDEYVLYHGTARKAVQTWLRSLCQG
jgi:hypothetical protein